MKRDRIEDAIVDDPRHVPLERPGPPGGKRDENRRARTRLLLESALELFLTNGIEGTTIDDIVQHAGIAKGSFYRYFIDKEELVEALFAPMRVRLEEAFTECQDALNAARDKPSLYMAYQQLAARLSSIVLEFPQMSRLYLQECRAPSVGARKAVKELQAYVSRHAMALTEVAKQQGLLKPANPTVTALAVVGAVEGLLYAFLSGDEIGDPDNAAGTLVSLVLDGLAVRLQ